MATRTAANPFATPGFGDGIFRLGSMLLGDGASEESRFRNLAHAETARARAGYDDERTAGARNARLAREAMSRALAPRADGSAPGFGDVVAQMPQHLVYLDTAEVGGPRAGVGLALAGGDPQQQARAVGGMGGDAGNTVYGVQTASGDRRYAADRAAGATVRAAQIGQDGANWRFLRGDANPGADGVYIGPDRGRALGFGDQTAPVFLPGAANIPPGNVRVTPAPGPVQATPQTVTVQGNPSRATGGVAGSTNPALDFYQRQLVEWEQGGRQGAPPALPEGVSMGDVVFGPGYAAQGLRNQGAAAVNDARIQARQQEVERQIEARLALAGVDANARRELETLRGQLRLELQGAQNAGAMERVLAGAEARLQQIGAAGANAAAVQGLRNDGAAIVQGLRNDGAATVQGLRNDGALAVQGARNDGALATTTARIEARAQEVERRIEAASGLAAQNAEARAALAEINGRLRSQLQLARDDAARERIVANAEAQMQRLEATLRSREGEGAANRAAAQQRTETTAAARTAAAQNRPLSPTQAADLRVEVTRQLDASVRGATNQPSIVAWVEGRASDYLRQGDPPGLAVERAINDARTEAGLQPRTSWLLGDPARMSPTAPAARRQGAPTAAPDNYRPDGQPPAPQDSGAPRRPQPGDVVRQNGRTFIIMPDGTARPAS